MPGLNLHLKTFDIGEPFAAPDDCARHFIDATLRAWSEGADLVVFPEFCWMVLERFCEGPDLLHGLSPLFWNRLWPELRRALSVPGKAVVLGTVPFLDDSGHLRNRAPILSDGRAFHQDKLHLTPWENAFAPGEAIHVWTFKQHRIAVCICLDVEIPSLTAALKPAELDLLLVPSATETLLGVERIGRCASARAVELGCQVAVCHLTGKTDSTLVDENVGRLSFYSPSQSAFAATDRVDEGVLLESGHHTRGFTTDPAAVRAARASLAETNPSRILARAIQLSECGEPWPLSGTGE
jgi:predicted amidohydrolase